MSQPEAEPAAEEARSPSAATTALKTLAGCAFLLGAVSTYIDANGSGNVEAFPRRRLSIVGDSIPSYMDPAMKDLKERKKLFDDTPPEEVKYWFEYAGPLQKYFYRFSKSRGKADYFEGRDDSGVTSSRFTEEYLGGDHFGTFYGEKHSSSSSSAQMRLLENCLAMGSPSRPDTSSPVWKEWFGGSDAKEAAADRCRVLFTLNTVGAGRGSTMIWETNPPLKNAHGPEKWTSEQETAATHLQRNFEEINAMCATGLIAARVQVLVCEPISAKWTEWMDSLLTSCGGQLSDIEKISLGTAKVEERPSPVQVVVVASSKTADICHNLKSGFMEKRVQDLILAPPYLGRTNNNKKAANPSVKTTHPDLISSDEHDLYVGLKWTSLVTLRTINSFLQASADLATAASSPENQKAAAPETNADGKRVVLSNSPSSPFLIPSFVRVSYVSEENAKVAKWRMHGDFFHPAAWEVCKDSFNVAWIDHSLSGSGGVTGLCYADGAAEKMKNRLDKKSCGQWWVYLTEIQMPTSPEVYANEVTGAIVQGGNNQFWMVTERQRREIVKRQVCVHEAGEGGSTDDCPAPPQAVIPLGDLESFMVNFTPNTALGKKHVHGRRPGYSREKERERERELVRERKQLKGQDDIEKALFDYTIYPVALFRKDATLKAARSRDALLTKKKKDGEEKALGPQTVKSSYYDVTITKPRPPVLGWCQSIARNGLCALYADYFRTSNDLRCLESCGMNQNWTPLETEPV